MRPICQILDALRLATFDVCGHDPRVIVPRFLDYARARAIFVLAARANGAKWSDLEKYLNVPADQLKHAGHVAARHDLFGAIRSTLDKFNEWTTNRPVGGM